jgi:hypothetical protein
VEVQGPGSARGRPELSRARRREPGRQAIAVDWSGRRHGAARFIWAAQVAGGELLGLANGRRREAVGDWLVDAALATPELAVGLDFAFSLPAWFLAEQGLAAAPELWELASARGEEWLAARASPFWGGGPGRRRPDLGRRAHFRATDRETAPTGPGIQPKSPFQVGGAGSVGTGSLRGMPLLRRLRQEGFSVWPFDDAPGWPRVVEIYPRALTGPVCKSDPGAREAHLALLGWPPDPALRAGAAASDDAFDAALSARAMDRHWDRLAALPPIPEPRRAAARLEGWIWLP